MTKDKFLNNLRLALGDLPEAEIQNSIDYYAEIIEEKIESGMSEEEAVRTLPSPDEIAREILLDMPLPKLIKKKCSKKRQWSAWEIVLLILGSPLWITLLAAAVVVFISVYAALWSVVAALWAVGAAFAGVSIGGAVVFAVTVGSNAFTALVYLGLALFGAGAAVLMFFGCLGITKAFAKLSISIVRLVKNLIIGKKKEVEDI